MSPRKYDVLEGDLASRVTYATTAMHAYSHQWSCQIIFNPRMKPGAGLSDGEGVERLWSRLRHLIGITRSLSVSA